MRTNGGFSRALVAVVVMAMALVTGAGVGGAGASAKAAGPSGTPLLVGWLGTQTQAGATATSSVAVDTMDAWAKWTNAHGGVNGHPVKFVYEKDDKGDPAVALSEIKDLVENKKVIAVVGSTSSAESNWADYALAQKIPIIGPTDVNTLPATNPMFYGVGGSVFTNIWGQMKSAAAQGVKKVGVLLCTENPACKAAQGLFTQAAKDVGMTATYNALASGTQPSYTAECLAAKQAGVQALAAFVNGVVLARDCSRQGFKPKWISAEDGPGRQAIKSSPALGNAVGSNGSWTCNGPELAKYHAFYAAMKQYHPEYKVGSTKWIQGGNGYCKGWAAGEAFKKAIENAAVAPTAAATRADVIRGLSMFNNEDLGGYTPHVTYSDGTKGNPPHTCVYLYKWSGLNFVRVPKDGSPTCKPS
jgi:branched-chain amino acid transport system substrate-binding protein